LAFDEAISDIYNQIKSECMKGVKWRKKNNTRTYMNAPIWS
jgi:hypothetical protein